MKQGSAQSQCSLDDICVNTIRTLSMDAIEQASSGHPGAPMGLASAAYLLWTRYLKHNPGNPAWVDRDRFVLSGGHASMLLYSLLFLTGYDLSLEDLRNFRQWGSKTPGHPEYGHTPGVETTTGPLGQGFANAVGMAMAERHLAARFNRPGQAIIDHHTYVMCGDGDLMEGVCAEAASLAGHLGLGKLICIYDDNKISIEGSTAITFTEDVALRFQAYKWDVQRVEDGNDLEAIEKALAAACANTDQPSLIVLRTEIAYGSPNKQGCCEAHGAPLGTDEVCLTKRNLGCPEDEVFCVPQTALDLFRQCGERGAAAEKSWQSLWQFYQDEYPRLAEELNATMAGQLPEGWDAALPDFNDSTAPVATRAASGMALNAIAERIPALIGGSADLAPSNKTIISTAHDFQHNSFEGRNIRFGVREHAMGAIMSGMALHGGVRPYGGTFLVFADYMRPAIRLAALMKLPVIYVFTHDSIAVGEDGPTHQPVEHLASLRLIPGLTVIRPADARETSHAWRRAIQTLDGPVALILSRQKLPLLEATRQDQLDKGAYILQDSPDKPDLVLIATGSEVHLALMAAQQLTERQIQTRVVNMPSWELFNRQSSAYRQQVLPEGIGAKMAIEAGHPMGWRDYVGNAGKILGVARFGASAPGNVMLAQFGFTREHIVSEALALLGR